MMIPAVMMENECCHDHGGTPPALSLPTVMMENECCHDHGGTPPALSLPTFIMIPAVIMENECCHDHGGRERLYRIIFGAVVGFLVLVAVVVFLVWAILRPTKPRFILQDAIIFAFNVSSPNFLTINMQITLSSRNPNDRIGIFYEKLDTYATYRNQQITLPTILPSGYQGHKDISVWSPFLFGNAVPITPLLSGALCQDLNAGMVLMDIKADGRVKWKVGTWISGKYRIKVKCPEYISFGDQSKGVTVGPAMKYQLVQPCEVDVSAN